MIASVSGRVAAVGPDTAVVEVGGVGLQVQCTPDTLARLRVGQPATLATALVVREDSLTLYGFADTAERVLFELLQTASGVGPRLAQSILAVHRPDAVRRAVAADDLAAFMLVPGIGRKGAQRIVLELKDRLGEVESGAPLPSTGAASVRAQVREALTTLGYGVREAEEAARALPADAEDGEVGSALKAALRSLDRR